jgi:enoyl-[acyl-carrier protein] reductase II
MDALSGILQVYFGGDMEAAPALAGQTVGLIDSVKSAQDIIDETVAEFFEITERLGALARNKHFG